MIKQCLVNPWNDKIILLQKDKVIHAYIYCYGSMIMEKSLVMFHVSCLTSKYLIILSKNWTSISNPKDRYRLYPHLSWWLNCLFQPYDFLALVPVIEGAGGIITDWKGDKLTWEASPFSPATSMCLLKFFLLVFFVILTLYLTALDSRITISRIAYCARF